MGVIAYYQRRLGQGGAGNPKTQAPGNKKRKPKHLEIRICNQTVAHATLLALPRNAFAQLNPCGPEELQATLPSNNVVYRNAVSLSKILSGDGIGVKCILRSTMENMFEGQEGAAVYRTDHGSFEVCFLSRNGTFERLKVTEAHEGGQRYLYRFAGPPQPWPSNLIDSAFPIYFVKDRNLLFVMESNKVLAQMLEKLVRSK
jgi:hypothetical protein